MMASAYGRGKATPLLRAEHLAQERSVQKFHREEGDVAVAVEFMYPNDVRVRQQLQMLKLALQLGQQLFALGHRRMQYFDGQTLARGRQIEAVFIHRLEHRAHSAVSEHSDHPIAVPQHIADGHFSSRRRAQIRRSRSVNRAPPGYESRAAERESGAAG